jgi:hypothetical protein
MGIAVCITKVEKLFSDMNAELHLNFCDANSNAHFWIALDLEELHHQQPQSLITVSFIYTDELVPNVLGITIHQYQTRNRLTQYTCN